MQCVACRACVSFIHECGETLSFLSLSLSPVKNALMFCTELTDSVQEEAKKIFFFFLLVVLQRNAEAVEDLVKNYITAAPSMSDV